MNQGYTEARGITALYARTAQAHVAAHVLRLAQNELEGEAIRLNPQHAKAYYNRGVVYGNLGKRVESERDIQKAKELGYSP